jgi:D-amino-acid oxidase
MDVLVIGAGVSGLTTGICLAEAGLAVTIRTAAPPERTTSAAAGAVWGLVRVGPPDRVLPWGRTGLEVLSALAAEPGTGIRLVSGQEVSRTQLEPHYWTGLLPGLRSCTESELPDGFADGWHYTAPVATMPVYLAYLRARFERAGGTLEVAPVAALAGLAGEAPVVVNCPGAAARDLVPDPDVMAVRGQVVIAANPGIEEFFINRDPEPPWIVYMFPHGEQILLGGTNDEGNWDEDPKTEIAERIVAGCSAIDPRLRGAEILGHRVGLRPCRPEVRLESEPLGGGVLWHNYGHGGAGISLSWGCAAEITASVCAQLSSLATRPRGAITRYASWQSSAISVQSTSPSSRTPIQPRPPTYGGRKNRPGSDAASSCCAPGGAAHHRCGNWLS